LYGCAVDRGSYGPFKRSLNTKSYGYSVEENTPYNSNGNVIERFEVRDGDCSSQPGHSDCKTDRERSELTEINKVTTSGSKYWYGWNIYFPKEYNNVYPTKVALGQFHQYHSSPAWMFQNHNGGYHLDGYTPEYITLIDKKELLGKWHKIEVQARWTRENDGYLNIWVNGVQKVKYTGRTMTASAIFFKYGIYRSFMSRYKTRKNADTVPSQVVYFSNVKRANTRDGLKEKLK